MKFAMLIASLVLTTTASAAELRGTYTQTVPLGSQFTQTSTYSFGNGEVQYETYHQDLSGHVNYRDVQTLNFNTRSLDANSIQLNLTGIEAYKTIYSQDWTRYFVRLCGLRGATLGETIRLQEGPCLPIGDGMTHYTTARFEGGELVIARKDGLCGYTPETRCTNLSPGDRFQVK